MSAIIEILRQLLGSLLRQWPDLIGTFYGVLMGGLATLGIVRWQVNEERRTRDRLDKEYLEVQVEHVNREITKNVHTLERLISAFGHSSRPRLELWDWAAAITGSFSSQAHDDLYRTGLQRFVPSDFEEQIRLANATVIDVSHTIQQARAAYIFTATYIEDGEVMNDRIYGETRDTLPDVLALLTAADEIVNPHHLPWVVERVAEARSQRRRSISHRFRRFKRRRRRS